MIEGDATRVLVRLDSVVKSYPQSRQPALNGISLEVAEGEFVALLGPSGSGKTTALRCIAGLESIGGGEIRLGERVVSSPGISISPAERNLGMVFQSYALWPHMSVFDNVAYALKVQRVPGRNIRERVERILSLLALSEKRASYPHELSGGQQQRVALARALVAEPALILFDEPLSNLDARLRDSMRVLIRDLTRTLGVAGIYVTHDRLDALVMADRVIVMNDGVVVQEGAPEELYIRPCNEFVAQFLGDVNIYDGTVSSVDGERVHVSLAGTTDQVTARANGGLRLCAGVPVRVAIRPNQVRLHAPGSVDYNSLGGTLEQVTFLGEFWRCRAALGSQAANLKVELLTTDPPTQAVGQPLTIYVSHAHTKVLATEVRNLPAEGP